MTLRVCMATALANLTLCVVAAPALGQAETGHYGPCDAGVGLTYAPTEHTWLGQTWRYRIIRNSLPVSGERRQNRYIARIRDGIRTWNKGRDRCGRRGHGGFDTSMISDTGVKGENTSGVNHTDARSTIDFANGIRCNGKPVRGCAHTERQGHNPLSTKAGPRYRAIESDIRMERQEWWVKRSGVFATTPPSEDVECKGLIDLFEFAAHEVGHAVGLGDLESGDRNNEQTMQNNYLNCQGDRRRLARGDWRGLILLYTYEPNP